MVKYINNSVCRGVAGKRSGKVKGVVIHNDAGSMNAEQYVNWLAGKSNSQLEAGFAHYYIDRNTVARVEDTYNKAWHTANADGNANYIGYEVCQSLSATDKEFLENEQAVFKQVAEDLKYYGLPANRDTVRLHKEFSATTCPHRSWDLHGKSVNAVKDYFISQINKYMNGSTPVTPSKPVEPTKPATKTVTVGAWATHYQTGQPIASFVKGKKYTVKQEKAVNQSNSKKAFLLDGINSWLLEQDTVEYGKANIPAPAPAPKLKGIDLSNTGYYAVPVATNIRSSASTSAPIVGLYNKGEGFNYDSKVTAGGYVWLSYVSYSGQRRYVAVV